MSDSTHPSTLSLPTEENPATVYSATICPLCNATYRALTKAGVPYRIINAQEDEEAAAYIKGLGYQRAPVVVLPDGTHWGMYRPDRITELGEAIAAAALQDQAA